jgi:hypothetical protein
VTLNSPEHEHEARTRVSNVGGNLDEPEDGHEPLNNDFFVRFGLQTEEGYGKITGKKILVETGEMGESMSL